MKMKYCPNCGADLADDALFCANCGEKIHKGNSLVLQQSSYDIASLPKDEVTRVVVEKMCTDGVTGLNKEELRKKLLSYYDNSIPRDERIEDLMKTFDIDYESADKVDWISSTKTTLFVQYFQNKEDCPTFDIKGKNGMLKSDVPIDDFISNIGFIIENDATPIFKRNVINNNITTVDDGLATYSNVNYVDFYETRAVRHSRGASYGKKGYRTHSSTSTSTQEWTKLGRGTLTLQGDKVYYVGGGQQRTIDRKKIVKAVYFNNKAGIEIAVSNRQKSMKFLLPGRDIEDGQRLVNAIRNGQTSVRLKELTKDPGNCYIATFVYGDYDAQEVLTLRQFRDERLLTNFFGKLFVKVYYRTSPFLIKHFGSKLFKSISKKVLDSFIKKLE
ncbi:MAG: zinc ribbon domain-containing protein [Methanobrevibacter sp.]|uniref:zinc ribbon domain-containing protein n=1 Tax=Methanobrevibacter sp. TaxID=66852 RepID=UPI003F074C3C